MRNSAAGLLLFCLITGISGNAFAMARSASGPIVLAADGKANYRICPSDDGEVLSFAAQELSRYLEQISGASFKIGPADGGKCIVLKSQTTGNARNKPALDGYKIHTEGPRILITAENPRAVLYGTYAFLRNLGCEWIAPDLSFFAGRHESIPSVDKLVYSGAVLESKADLKYRKIYVEEGRSHNLGNLAKIIDWMGKSGMNTFVCPMDYQGQNRVVWDDWRAAITPELKKRGIAAEIGGHGYQNFLKPSELFDKHPEWFAKDKQGNRTDNIHWVFCTSNDQAMARFHKNLIAYLSDHPEIDIFDLWPPDGARWCTCSECKKLGSPTHRHGLVVKRTQKKLEEQFPDLTMEFLAYASYISPPEVNLPDNMLLDFAALARNYQHPIYSDKNKKNQDYYKDLSKWLKVYDGDISIYSYYRKYAWTSRPLIIPRFMQDEIKHYHSIGIKGISSYAEPGDWFTYGLNHYCLSNIAWDMDSDIDQLLEKYCRTCYQKGSQQAKKVYNYLEPVSRIASGIPHNDTLSVQEYEKNLAELRSLRRETISKADNYTSVTRSHLQKMGNMLEYLIKDIELNRSKAMGKPVKQRRSQVDAIREFLLEYPNQGIFMLHFRLGSRLYRYYKCRN